MLLFIDAKPTEIEKEIYAEVVCILRVAPQLMEEMKAYSGASNEIREVR